MRKVLFIKLRTTKAYNVFKKMTKKPTLSTFISKMYWKCSSDFWRTRRCKNVFYLWSVDLKYYHYYNFGELCKMWNTWHTDLDWLKLVTFRTLTSFVNCLMQIKCLFKMFTICDTAEKCILFKNTYYLWRNVFHDNYIRFRIQKDI